MWRFAPDRAIPPKGGWRRLSQLYPKGTHKTEGRPTAEISPPIRIYLATSTYLATRFFRMCGFYVRNGVLGANFFIECATMPAGSDDERPRPARAAPAESPARPLAWH